MIPKTHQEIREWVTRLGVTEERAAVALGLGNADTVMREYCSDKRKPAMTTRFHMDLLELTRDAKRALDRGDVTSAQSHLTMALFLRLPHETIPKETDNNGR